VLKNFNKSQHRIRNEWRSKQSKLVLQSGNVERDLKQLQQMLKSAFS